MPDIKKQIHILDDDVSVGRALNILLSSYGYQVVTYSSVHEYFNAPANSVPGCLILDIHMPGLDGWEVMQRLAKSGSKLPVIVISAEKSGGPKQQADEAGAVGFLQKPFMAKGLVALIQKALEIKEKILPERNRTNELGRYFQEA